MLAHTVEFFHRVGIKDAERIESQFGVRRRCEQNRTET